MLELLFSFKRVYLTGVRHMTEALRAHGLTPARLDVLRLLLEGVTTQKELRRALGVARSTISRMLSAMVRRGLIVRASTADQRATKYVAIAPDVAALLAELMPPLERAVGAGVATALRMRPNHHFRWFFEAVASAEYEISALREALGDRATRDRTPMLSYFEDDFFYADVADRSRQRQAENKSAQSEPAKG
jgi:DNA-binding MarR family transcriptional regulator